MGTVTEVMNKAKVPMFVGADSMVMDGGLGTVGIEYSDLGKETANMAAQILSGEKEGFRDTNKGIQRRPQHLYQQDNC